MELRIANDIGNSTDKMYVDDTLIRQPTVIKRIPKIPDSTDADIQRNVANLLDELCIHVTSPSIKQPTLCLVGKRALHTADRIENMNIILGNKFQQDLSIIQTLAMISGRAVQLQTEKNGSLPKNIELKVTMATAIPSSEYTSERARILENRFLDATHIVVVYVGSKEVHIKIEFDRVKVTQEGVAALYAILEGKDDMFSLFNKRYKDMKYTAKDFRDKKMLHADIGDGTTEYPFTSGLQPIPDACSGELRGVGHTTQDAIISLKEELGGHLRTNRQQFMSILNDESHHLNKEAIRHMDQSKYAQARSILEDIQAKYLNNAASEAEIIPVYGGGSIVFKKELYDDLVAFSMQVKAKVLWIPEKYAVDMNIEGLKILRDNVFFKKAVKA